MPFSVVQPRQTISNKEPIDKRCLQHRQLVCAAGNICLFFSQFATYACVVASFIVSFPIRGQTSLDIFALSESPFNTSNNPLVYKFPPLSNHLPTLDSQFSHLRLPTLMLHDLPNPQTHTRPRPPTLRKPLRNQHTAPHSHYLVLATHSPISASLGFPHESTCFLFSHRPAPWITCICIHTRARKLDAIAPF
jgi:hypothetical protein